MSPMSPIGPIGPMRPINPNQKKYPAKKKIPLSVTKYKYFL